MGTGQMSKFHVKVKGGDEILIDLGSYGIEIFLDKQKQWYDIRYVTIDYNRAGNPKPNLLPADMIVSKSGTPPLTVKQADCVRIFRHSR